MGVVCIWKVAAIIKLQCIIFTPSPSFGKLSNFEDINVEREIWREILHFDQHDVFTFRHCCSSLLRYS